MLLAWALAAAAAVPGLSRLSTDNSPETYFLRGATAVKRHELFRREFGSDAVVRIAVSGQRLWSPEGLDWLREVERAAEALPGVEAAGGLYSHHGRDGLWPPEDIEAFRERVVGNTLDRNFGWIDARGTTASVVVAAIDREGDSGLLRALDELIAAPPAGVQARLIGSPVLNRALDEGSRQVERRFFPLLVVLALLLLGFVFRSVGGVAIPMLFVATCQILLLGLMGYAGARLNMVLAILPPLILSIALATAIHLLMRVRELRSRCGTSGSAVEETYRDKGWAVLATGLTTTVGFAALASSPVGPVRSLGAWAAAGSALVTLCAFLLYPALLSVLPEVEPDRRSLERGLQRVGRLWAAWAARRRRLVLASASLLVTAALVGLPRLSVESNALNYLSPTHPVRRGISELENQGIASAAVEISLHNPAAGSFDGGRAMQGLAWLALRLREETNTLGVVGAGDLVEDALRSRPEGTRAVGGAAPREEALRRLREDERGRRLLRRFVTEDGRRARLTVFARTLGFTELAELRQRLLTTTREEFPTASVETTGEYPLLLDMQRHLLETLARSLLLTITCVAIVFALLLREPRLTLLAMAPNLWPVVLSLGGMGWLGVPVDIATVMMASIILGLAVDNTIHTLAHFRELGPRYGARQAVAGTLERTAPAYVLTGLILAAGFGVCTLSDFAPIQRFGAVCAGAIGLALVGDLVLVPALLAGIGGHGGSVPEHLSNATT